MENRTLEKIKGIEALSTEQLAIFTLKIAERACMVAPALFRSDRTLDHIAALSVDLAIKIINESYDTVEKIYKEAIK